MTDHVILGAAVQALREAEGWTQKQLAEKVPGWTHSIVSATERGVRPHLALDELEALAQALNVDPYHLWREPRAMADTASLRRALASIDPLRDQALSLLKCIQGVQEHVASEPGVVTELAAVTRALAAFVATAHAEEKPA